MLGRLFAPILSKTPRSGGARRRAVAKTQFKEGAEPLSGNDEEAGGSLRKVDEAVDEKLEALWRRSI